MIDSSGNRDDESEPATATTRRLEVAIAILDNSGLYEVAALIAGVPWKDRDRRLFLLKKVAQALQQSVELSRQELLLKTLAELVEAMQGDSNHELSELFKTLSNYAQTQLSGNTQLISELEEAKLLVEARRKVRNDEVDQLLARLKRGATE